MHRQIQVIGLTFGIEEGVGLDKPARGGAGTNGAALEAGGGAFEATPTGSAP